ncbi:MAG: ABC transporter permease [Solirubrobacteraceae bacterium]|nr:ABC transporter permease [Solirubrobacteraceae bacterium]
MWRQRAASADESRTGNLVRALWPLLGVTLVVLVAPLLAPYGSTDINPAGALQAPSGAAWFGTDELSRDVFSRVLFGLRTSWLSALAVIAVGAVIGSVIGAVAGAVGGWVDAVLMRTTDLFLAMPAPVLAIAVVAALGPSLRNTLIALAVVWWPWYARIVRGEVRRMAARPHAEAARLAGVSRARLIRKHLLPGAVAPVFVTMSLDVANLVLALASLSFIGLGAPPPAAELGAMSARATTYLLDQPWVSVAPGVAVAVLALAGTVIGDRANRRIREGAAR